MKRQEKYLDHQETIPKEAVRSEIKTRRTVEDKKMVEDDINIIEEFMRNIKEEKK